MQFEFYVLNYDCNKKKVVNYNIFNNIRVQEWTEKAVRKYLRSPKNFSYTPFGKDVETIYGFDAFIREIEQIQALILHAGSIQAGTIVQLDGADTLTHSLRIGHPAGGKQLVGIAYITILHRNYLVSIIFFIIFQCKLKLFNCNGIFFLLHINTSKIVIGFIKFYVGNADILSDFYVGNTDIPTFSAKNH